MLLIRLKVKQCRYYTCDYQICCDATEITTLCGPQIETDFVALVFLKKTIRFCLKFRYKMPTYVRVLMSLYLVCYYQCYIYYFKI
jgi:hypothetical protein